MAKKANNVSLDESKSRFISDLNAILSNPKEILFSNGELDKNKLSTFLNSFVQAYLQEDAKKLGISQDKIPLVALHNDLLTTPPGDPTGKNSFGNYNQYFNFIEVNANRFNSNMSNSELSQKLVTTLVGVGHEYRHFLQSMLANDGVPTSQVVSKTEADAPDSAPASEDDVPTSVVISDDNERDRQKDAHFETRVPLDKSQKEGLIGILGSDKASQIEEDLLYGFGKIGLIAVAEYNQDQSSAFADGNKAARSTLFSNDTRAPIIQAYYYNLAHEIDARTAAPEALMSVAKDSGIFSKNFLKFAKESVSQTAKAHIDSFRQPKGAVDALINTAVGKKKGDPGITPEMIERYYLASPDTLNVSSSAEQHEYVVGAIFTILNNLEGEQLEQFLTALNETSIDKSIIAKAVETHESRKSKISHVSKDEILEVDPHYYDKPKATREQEQQSTGLEAQKDGLEIEDEPNLQ